jgi:hypothetical protein
MVSVLAKPEFVTGRQPIEEALPQSILAGDDPASCLLKMAPTPDVKRGEITHGKI